MKERIVNIRPLFVVWLSMMLGILTFYCFTNVLNLGKSYFWLVLLLLVDVSVLVLFVISFVKSEKLAIISKHKWLYLVSIVCMLIPLLHVGFKYASYKKYPYLSGEVDIVGRVESCTNSSGTSTIVLSDCSVGDDKQNVEHITLYVSNQLESVDVGTTVSASATIRTLKLFTDENNIIKYSKNKIYTAYCQSNNFYLIGKGDLTLAESIRKNVNDALHDNLNEDNASVAYGMLFGDKSYMSADVYDAFSFAGVSHMLAVSGLHVGFLVAFITFLLSLFRVPDKANIVIISIFLLCYCVLCDFTASVVRATVMSIVLLLGNLLGAQHDNLSSLSLSGTIILLINPFQLFDYGFQLSFMCVLAMMTLNKYIFTFLVKIKVPRWLSASFSVSFSVNIALIPLTAILFGSINLIGIVSNLILVPIFSVAFPLLFFGAFASALFNFLGFTLFVPNILLHFIRLICDFISNHSWQIQVLELSYGVLVLMIAFLLTLKYLMLKIKAKTILLCLIVSVMLGLSVVGVLPKTYSTNSLISWGQYDSNCSIITTRSGKKILFDYDEYYLSKNVRNAKITNFDGWVLPSFTLSKIDEVLDTVKKYKIEKLYVSDDSKYNDYSLAKLSKYCDIEYVGEVLTEADGFNVQMFASENRVYGVLIKTSKTLLFDMGMTSGQMSEIEEKLTPNINYCITKSAKYDTDNDLKIIRDVICTKDAVENKIKSIADSSTIVLQL